MNQYQLPEVPQPPTYIPPPQVYKGSYRPVPGSVAANQVPSLPAEGTERQKGQTFRIAFFAAIGFFVLSHPIAYRVVNQVVSLVTGKTSEIMTEIGTATTKGVVLHAVVFFVFIMVLLFRQ